LTLLDGCQTKAPRGTYDGKMAISVPDRTALAGSTPRLFLETHPKPSTIAMLAGGRIPNWSPL
jgi:hypothetical protein